MSLSESLCRCGRWVRQSKDSFAFFWDDYSVNIIRGMEGWWLYSMAGAKGYYKTAWGAACAQIEYLRGRE